MTLPNQQAIHRKLHLAKPSNNFLIVPPAPIESVVEAWEATHSFEHLKCSNVRQILKPIVEICV